LSSTEISERLHAVAPELAAKPSATRRIVNELITAKELVRATRRMTDPLDESPSRWTKNTLALPDEATSDTASVLQEEQRILERHERYRRRALTRSNGSTRSKSVGERVNTPSALTLADIEPETNFVGNET
jgi:hypothetical protein